MNRRHFLSSAMLASLAPHAVAAESAADSFDFAYLTDIHVQPELGAAEGFRQCLDQVNLLKTPADFVLTGGDLIMDALDVGMNRVRQQFEIFDECMKRLSLPVHHTIGNHDVVGWSAKSVVQPDDHDYGKKLFADRYGRGRTYRSFDHKGWHFIILDSIGQNQETRDYQGWIDDAQLDWLKKDLAATGRSKPIIMVSHIPFYTTWHQVLGGPTAKLDGKAIVGNLHTFRKLFDDYNIQLVLSGHGHVVERIEIGKVTYLQGGAVCGMWWKGPVFGKPEGFGTITCRRDGTWNWQYRDYGWKARK
ncbi:MAG: metallophosphoesterase [Verrucomicrobiota bacterium]|jgi:3',5'-cyclic AMP phosphodiesterase CpdA